MNILLLGATGLVGRNVLVQRLSRIPPSPV